MSLPLEGAASLKISIALMQPQISSSTEAPADLRMAVRRAEEEMHPLVCMNVEKKSINAAGGNIDEPPQAVTALGCRADVFVSCCTVNSSVNFPYCTKPTIQTAHRRLLLKRL